MERLSLNSVSSSVFEVRANETADGSKARADIISEGRLLAYEHARRGKSAIDNALNIRNNGAAQHVSDTPSSMSSSKQNTFCMLQTRLVLLLARPLRNPLRTSSVRG